MKPSSAKAKGRALQDWTRKRLMGGAFDIHEDDIKTAVMGESGEDIKDGSCREKFPFSVECKNVEKLNVWEAYEQAKENWQL